MHGSGGAEIEQSFKLGVIDFVAGSLGQSFIINILKRSVDFGRH